LTEFVEYAPWYDLIYEDKDYVAEAAFVEQQLHCHGAKSGALLDLGCGTGMHAIEFARRGWIVTGIDLSERMIDRAKARLSNSLRVSFRQGDVCLASGERDFDAVISLFHVASYQTSTSRLESMIATARAALKPGGILLFDYWYGEAVLAQGVQTRVKVIERPPLRLTRIAQPVHDEANALVEVKYTLFCEDMVLSAIKRVEETHRLRYWLPLEIDSSLRASGLDPVGHYAWLSNDKPDPHNWAAYSVARKLPLT
jgi:SAM-dependent methyltransferase